MWMWFVACLCQVCGTVDVVCFAIDVVCLCAVQESQVLKLPGVQDLVSMWCLMEL
jgi:hypothetical protein